MVSAGAWVQQDGYSHFNRNQVRSLHQLSKGGAGGDLYTGMLGIFNRKNTLLIARRRPNASPRLCELVSSSAVQAIVLMSRRYGLTVYLLNLLPRCKNNTNSTHQIFKIVLSKAFDLKCTIPEIENTGEPLLIYQQVA